jgi:hypothetical protein
MANFIPKIIKPLLNYVPNDSVQDLTSLASKAMRLKIIADRYTRGFTKEDVNGPGNAYEYEQQSKTFPGVKEHREKINPTYGNDKGTQIDTNGYLSEQANIRQSRVNSNNTADYISIIDIDYVPADHDDKRYYSYLQLPFVPRELDYNPESNFVGIASFGRNNPFYQFTGSEDTLSFEIDWHSKENEREDVIFNCRWLEALTKGDAYDEMPHRVVLSWGRDNKLFADSVWLVVAAPYRLSEFVRSFRDPSDNTIVNVGMLPQQAYQQITLKRLTKLNRSTREIIGSIGKPTNK